jgi:hypothetical protein
MISERTMGEILGPLSAAEKQKFFTEGDGTPPLPGWEWSDTNHAWEPGPDAKLPSQPKATKRRPRPPLALVEPRLADLSGEQAPATWVVPMPPRTKAPRSVHIVTDAIGAILAVHADKTKAERDVALIRKASAIEVQIHEFEVE